MDIDIDIDGYKSGELNILIDGKTYEERIT